MLRALLLLNIIFFSAHVHWFCESALYFFQLTIIGQIMVLVSFTLSVIMSGKVLSLERKYLLSRLHIITLSLESIIVIGYWGLRIFFTKGIMKQGEQRNLYAEFLCFWVHGGSFLTMLFHVHSRNFIFEGSRVKKLLQHMSWALTFLFLQYLHWYLSGTHSYGFLKHLSWIKIIIF